MSRQTMVSWIRMALLGAAVSLAFGSVAWGQAWVRYDDYDRYYYHDEAREHGFQNGYRDGLDTGANDGRRGQSYDPESSHFYRHGDYGFSSILGARDAYKRAYRDGFLRGYQEGYQNWQRYFINGTFHP